jgi:hypothetical protein
MSEAKRRRVVVLHKIYPSRRRHLHWDVPAANFKARKAALKQLGYRVISR